VGGRDAFGRLGRDIEEPAAGDRAAIDQSAEGLAFDQFGDDVRLPVGLSDVVDGDDIGVVERAERARLLLEPLAADHVAGNVSGQDLDGDGAVEAAVLRAPDLSHAALAELLENVIIAESAAGHGVLLYASRVHRSIFKVFSAPLRLRVNPSGRPVSPCLCSATPAAPRSSPPRRPPAATPGRTARRAGAGSTAPARPS